MRICRCRSLSCVTGADTAPSREGEGSEGAALRALTCVFKRYRSRSSQSSHGVVIGIAGTSHRWPNSQLFAACFKRNRGVLASRSLLPWIPCFCLEDGVNLIRREAEDIRRRSPEVGIETCTCCP